MWQLLLPQLMNYLQEHNSDLRRRLLSLAHLDATAENGELVTILTTETCHKHMARFVEMSKGRNPNCQFWWQYMQMVNVLLLVIRAQRDGICIRLDKCSHIFIDMIIPIIPGGGSHISCWVYNPAGQLGCKGIRRQIQPG